MELSAFDRPPAIAGSQEGDVAPSPPGTERVENLFELLGVAIFTALLVAAAMILIRQYRR